MPEPCGKCTYVSLGARSRPSLFLRSGCSSSHYAFQHRSAEPIETGWLRDTNGEVVQHPRSCPDPNNSARHARPHRAPSQSGWSELSRHRSSPCGTPWLHFGCFGAFWHTRGSGRAGVLAKAASRGEREMAACPSCFSIHATFAEKFFFGFLLHARSLNLLPCRVKIKSRSIRASWTS